MKKVLLLVVLGFSSGFTIAAESKLCLDKNSVIDELEFLHNNASSRTLQRFMNKAKESSYSQVWTLIPESEASAAQELVTMDAVQSLSYGDTCTISTNENNYIAVN